jgi:hypothetical protein
MTDERECGTLMCALDDYDGWPALRATLQLLALTMTRPGDVRGMRRSEINFEKAFWRIPAERMKMRRPHDVPPSRQALVRDVWLRSATYLDDEGNNTPFFFIPVFAVGACMYFLLPVDLFVVLAVPCAASLYAHAFFFDKEYHVEGSRFLRFAWFRRKQELHFVHHRHANSNFGVVHFFWDRVLGTYRGPDIGQLQTIGKNLNNEPLRVRQLRTGR